MTDSDKDAYFRHISSTWPGYDWSRSSDILVYFWVHAHQFVRPGGHLSLLTQSAWLDVEYGIPLQKWMLDNFCIEAVIESEAEPWFTDARVATVVTILKKERNPDLHRLTMFTSCRHESGLTAFTGRRIPKSTDKEMQSVWDAILNTKQMLRILTCASGW